MLAQLPATLALVGIVVLVSSLLSGVVERTGLPQVAIFLLLGALLGSSGLGLIDFTLASPSLRVIATLSLVLVLFSDAIGLDTVELRQNRRLALLVLGPGTILPAAIVAASAWLLLGVSVPAALVLGASLASTDPVLLRTLLRRSEIPASARLALRLESGMNDVVLLPIVALSLLALAPPASGESQHLGRHLLGLFVLGPLFGAVIGWAAITLLEQVRKRAGVRRDYESLYALGVAFTAYAAAEAVGGSGFLAAFAAGAVIAALDVELCDCFLDYGEASAEMFLVLTFVAFGGGVIWSGVPIADVRTLGFAVIALGVRTAVLLPVLRRARIDDESRRMIAWFGPRGLSSLLLVLLAVFAGIPGSDHLFAIVALVVLLSVVVHGGAIALFLHRPAPASEADAAGIAAAGARDEQAAAAHAAAAHAAAAHAARAPIAAPRPRETPAAEPVAEAPVADRITIDETRALLASGAPVTIIDARTERTWRDDPRIAQHAIRLPPDDAVRTARRLRLEQRATLVVYCA